MVVQYNCKWWCQNIICGCVSCNQCNQIGRFIVLWATFQNPWQIFLPKSPTFLVNFVKLSKSFIFIVKLFLANFYRHLATFYWSRWLQPQDFGLAPSTICSSIFRPNFTPPGGDLVVNRVSADDDDVKIAVSRLQRLSRTKTKIYDGGNSVDN